MIQRSLVLIKPDALKRGLFGEVMMRFERMGLKIVALKMVKISRDLAEAHYLTTDENLTAMGNKTITSCREAEIDVESSVGTSDPIKIGKIIWNWNVEFLMSAPIIAMVLEAPNAIENIRTQVGFTIPTKAAPGTIRGDYSTESSIGANLRNRTVYTLVHASGNVEEAKREIDLWFKPEELFEYKRIHEDFYGY